MSLRSILSFAFLVLFSAAALQTSHAQNAPDDAPTEPPQADEKLTPPSLKQDAQPVYPATAQEEGVAAEVLLDIDIDAAGLVENAKVVRGAEPQGYGFDEAAIAAAKQLLFEPARVGSQAVPVTISYRFRFVPDVKEEPAVVVPIEAPPPPPAPHGPTNRPAHGARNSSPDHWCPSHDLPW